MKSNIFLKQIESNLVKQKIEKEKSLKWKEQKQKNQEEINFIIYFSNIIFFSPFKYLYCDFNLE